MRDIKFRGKRKDNGAWAEGFLTSPCTIGVVQKDTETEYSITHIEVHPESIGQYTGLKDANGKEIYEGDIFTVNGSYPKLVKYMDGHACFCIANIDQLNNRYVYPWQQASFGWWHDFRREIMLIGNEIDNPELLER